MKNLAIASVAGLALAASANAQVVDLSGQVIHGASSNAGSTSTSSGVTAIAFDLSYTTFSPSWGEEVIIDISGPGGFAFTSRRRDFDPNGPPRPDDLTFGWGATTGTFSFSGTASVSGGAGTYSVNVFEVR